MTTLLTRVQIVEQIPELKNGRNFWYWAMKAKADPVDKRHNGGNITYLYSVDSVERIKVALQQGDENDENGKIV